MKNFQYKLHGHHWINNRIIIILVCVFISLLCLQGESYAQCNCEFPDEIMDLECFFCSDLLSDELTTCCESLEGRQFVSCFETKISFVYISYIVKNFLFLECLHLKNSKKRLFILQRYNSWNFVPAFPIKAASFNFNHKHRQRIKCESSLLDTRDYNTTDQNMKQNWLIHKMFN